MVMIAVRIPPEIRMAMIIVEMKVPFAETWVDLLHRVVNSIDLANFVHDAVEADPLILSGLDEITHLDAGVLDRIAGVGWVAWLNLLVVFDVTSNAIVACNSVLDPEVTLLDTRIEVVPGWIELADVFIDVQVRVGIGLALSNLKLIAAHDVTAFEIRTCGLAAITTTEIWFAGESWDSHCTEQGE
jgi:hypothetical protein